MPMNRPLTERICKLGPECPVCGKPKNPSLLERAWLWLVKP